MMTQNVIRLESNPVDSKETSFDEICEDICFDKIYFFVTRLGWCNQLSNHLCPLPLYFSESNQN